MVIIKDGKGETKTISWREFFEMFLPGKNSSGPIEVLDIEL